jgi:hypothetical protein
MKYFHKLILLGIFLNTILFGYSIELPHIYVNKNQTVDIPIFIYNVTGLESIDLEIEYDETVIIAQQIISDDGDSEWNVLGNGYTYTSNVSNLGIIEITIYASSDNLFSGSGMFGKIQCQTIGQIGQESLLTFSESQISHDMQVPSVDGSVEIILDELNITGIASTGTGAGHSITLGMFEICTDG